MKLKHSKDISLKLLVTLGFISGLVFAVLRCLQTAKFIDPETGFSIGSDFITGLVYGIAAALAVAFILIGYFSKDTASIDLYGIKNKTAGAFSVAFGIALVYDCFDSFFQSITLAETGFIGSEFSEMMTSGVFPAIMQSIFAIISAFYIFFLAKDFLKGTTTASKHRILALMPVVWAGFKLISRFIKKINYIKVSDLFFELFLYSFMLLFFLAVAQLVSNVYSDEGRGKLVSCGLSGAVIAFGINASRLAFTIAGGAFVNKQYPFNLADFLFSLFAFFLVKAVIEKIESEKENAVQKNLEE